MKIHSVGAKQIHSNGMTGKIETTKVTATFHSLANTPQNEHSVTSPTHPYMVHLCLALCVSH